ESVRHFVERELVKLLEDSKTWGLKKTAAGDIRLGSNRVLIELCCPELSEAGLWIAIEEQAGWLVAGVAHPGWLAALSFRQSQALATALAGFYKLGGVHLIREQIEECLAPARPPYDIADEGLVVWPAGFDWEAVYDLRDGEVVRPKAPAAPAPGLPAIPLGRLLYQDVPVTWDRWV